MPNIDALLMNDHLCSFTSEGDDCEERGCGTIPTGAPVYFFSDGGWDCREGSYRCEKHARELLIDHYGPLAAVSK